jgi:hypothetical protein
LPSWTARRHPALSASTVAEDGGAAVAWMITKMEAITASAIRMIAA